MSTRWAFIAVLAVLPLLTGTAHSASIGRCGGDGGSQTAQLSCPSGQYVVGLSAKGGKYVDRLGVQCAPFNAAGVRRPIAYSAGAGGTGGTQSAGGVCGGNGAFVRILGRGGAWLDKLDLARCAERKASGGFAGTEGANSTLVEFYVGGGGGRPCTLACPTGQAIHKITVRYGSWIDSIEVFCRP